MADPLVEQRVIPGELLTISAAGVGGIDQGKAAHSHIEGQLSVIADGLLILDVGGASWMMPSGHIGWIPPGIVHAATPYGLTSGWNAYLQPSLCERLPSQPMVLKMTPLAEALCERIASWQGAAVDAAVRERAIMVLIDELQAAPAEDLHLPVPQDSRLRMLTAQIAADPANKTMLAMWATKVGMSERGLTRHFRRETGMSLVKWRTMARMKQAIEMLAEGRAVSDAAIDLGYDSVSSFIAQFRRTFGTTPSRHGARGAASATDTRPRLQRKVRYSARSR